MQSFHDACNKVFGFLDTDYGFRVSERVVGDDDLDEMDLVRYSSQASEVEVQRDARHPGIFVEIARIPPITPTPEIDSGDRNRTRFDLSELLESRDLPPIFGDAHSSDFEKSLVPFADALVNHGADILRGEWDALPELQRVRADRVRRLKFNEPTR